MAFLVKPTKVVPQMSVVMSNPYAQTKDVGMNVPPATTVQMGYPVALKMMTSMYATAVATGSIVSLTVIVLEENAVNTVGFYVNIVISHIIFYKSHACCF
jgi:hypothetical protein